MDQPRLGFEFEPGAQWRVRIAQVTKEDKDVLQFRVELLLRILSDMSISFEWNPASQMR